MNPINPKLKIYRYNTVMERPNPNFGYTPIPNPNPGNTVQPNRWHRGGWREYDSSGYVTENHVHHSYVIADTMANAMEFIKRRNLNGEKIDTSEYRRKPVRLRQQKLAGSYLVSGRMRSQMGRNWYTNHDLGVNCASLRDQALPFCSLVVSSGLMSAEEMWHPLGFYTHVGLWGNFSHKLLDRVIELEKQVPGVTPDYALQFAAGNIK